MIVEVFSFGETQFRRRDRHTHKKKIMMIREKIGKEKAYTHFNIFLLLVFLPLEFVLCRATVDESHERGECEGRASPMPWF